MTFDRTRLPDRAAYFDAEGLKLTGPGKWKTTACAFHGGSDSMRVNTATGGWCCMNCGAKGGDVLSYHMQAHGLEFVEAARQLGAWIDDGKPAPPVCSTTLSARSALSVLAFETTLISIEAGRMAKGMVPSPDDLARVLRAANRINLIAEDYA